MHYGYLTLTKKSQNNTQIKTWPRYYGYAFVDPTPIYIFRGPITTNNVNSGVTYLMINTINVF
jgi:hypothetical protein